MKTLSRDSEVMGEREKLDRLTDQKCTEASSIRSAARFTALSEGMLPQGGE